MENAVEACGLRRVISKLKLLNSLKAVKSEYIEESRYTEDYEFVHVSFHEVVSSHTFMLIQRFFFITVTSSYFVAQKHE